MADSDDETLTTFGTPFEPVEEDAPLKRAVPIHEQIATDCEGRRRFHGAFTGGFSAGYFNTVGTKEGWQPSTFVSSRAKKAEQRAQKPEDFMDDDDVGDFGIAPRKIATREGFLSTKNEFERCHRKRVVTSESLRSVIPGEPPLQDVVVPVRMSIGVELLKKMGWKEGQGIGPRERRTKKKVDRCSTAKLFPADSLASAIFVWIFKFYESETADLIEPVSALQSTLIISPQSRNPVDISKYKIPTQYQPSVSIPNTSYPTHTEALLTHLHKPGIWVRFSENVFLKVVIRESSKKVYLINKKPQN